MEASIIIIVIIIIIINIIIIIRESLCFTEHHINQLQSWNPLCELDCYDMYLSLQQHS